MHGDLALGGIRKPVAEPTADERRDERRNDDPDDKNDVHPIEEMSHKICQFAPDATMQAPPLKSRE